MSSIKGRNAARIAFWRTIHVHPGWLSSHRESQRLSFTMAVRVLLGFRVSEEEMKHLFATFQDFVDNLFSLPIDLPFSGYRKVRGRGT